MGRGNLAIKAVLLAVVFVGADAAVTTHAATAQDHDAIGVKRAGRFHLRDSNSGGPADRTFTFGRAGDTPLVGDWNGDGIDTVGIRRGNRFHLRNSNTGGPANHTFKFGHPSDDPIVGDWNGDGIDTVGVQRGGRFHLRNSNTGGPADRTFTYGRAGDDPLVGDWNGDGIDTAGMRRGNRFHLRNSNTGGPADHTFKFGRAEDAPVAGQWEAPSAVEVSSFTTPLVPGQPRNTNIHLAADYIDGDVIPSGATYSLNQGIGQRTSERGFIGNGYIDEGGDVISVVGGGVSQMATTFLNAAWFSGIELAEFRQHTIYFERYPMCREATLTWGQLDVVVVNDTPYDLTIDTSYTDSSVTVRLVGRGYHEVDSWTGAPYDRVGDSFTVDCGRTVTSPDGTTSEDAYTWRYDETG